MKYEVPVLEIIPVNFTIDTLTASASGDGEHQSFNDILNNLSSSAT